MENSWLIIDENDENIRLDNYLSDLLESASRSHFQKLIKGNKVLVNGKSSKPSYKIRLGDKIELAEEEKETALIPENIPLEIVYEDENMLVVNKPSGMLTHPSENEKTGTLVNALLFKYGENLSDINGYFRRGIVHRLDRNTSGLLMIAKNNKTHKYLSELFKIKSGVEKSGNGRFLSKRYLAIVKGIFDKDEGELNFPIGRNKSHPEKMAVVDDGKPSITGLKVLKRFKEQTLIELDLKTGRTHQIRVHLSHVGHPILDDTLYGAGNFKVKTQEQVLQAYKLEFTKPFSDDIIILEIEPDEKIQHVLRFLENLK